MGFWVFIQGFVKGFVFIDLIKCLQDWGFCDGFMFLWECGCEGGGNFIKIVVNHEKWVSKVCFLEGQPNQVCIKLVNHTHTPYNQLVNPLFYIT